MYTNHTASIWHLFIALSQGRASPGAPEVRKTKLGTLDMRGSISHYVHLCEFKLSLEIWRSAVN